MSAAIKTNKFLLKYIEKKDNIYFSNRLFVANTVLNWVLTSFNEQKVIKYYLKEIEKHLKGEITLYWENGIIKVRKDT